GLARRRGPGEGGRCRSGSTGCTPRARTGSPGRGARRPRSRASSPACARERSSGGWARSPCHFPPEALAAAFVDDSPFFLAAGFTSSGHLRSTSIRYFWRSLPTIWVVLLIFASLTHGYSASAEAMAC